MAQSGGGGRARRGAGEESADGARLTALAASRSTDSIGCVSLRLNRSSERRGPGGELGGCEDRVTVSVITFGSGKQLFPGWTATVINSGTGLLPVEINHPTHFK